MNLIKQLGGYEKAKSIVDKAPCKTYTFHNHPYQKGYIRCFGGDGKEYFLVSDIEEALLEYRRQHNIFEDGDICKLKIKHDFGLYKFRRIDGDRIYLEDRLGFAEFGINKGVVEHATDAEIKAGKRL